MARIRVLKVKGGIDPNKPKVTFFHKDNFDDYTTKKTGKYTVMVIGRKQKSDYLNNQIKAYSDKIRFHKTGTPRYT